MNEGIRQTYVRALEAAQGILTQEIIGAKWADDSALPKWSVGGVAGHLARTAHAVEEYLDAGPASPDAKLLTAPEYFAAVLGVEGGDNIDSDLHIAIRGRGDRAAEAGHARVVAELAACIPRLRDRLKAEPADATLNVFGGVAMLVDEYLRTRVVEINIHIDDVAMSVGIPTPDLPGVAETNRLLVDVARIRHGDLGVLRALTRRERDPDSVLRVL